MCTLIISEFFLSSSHFHNNIEQLRTIFIFKFIALPVLLEEGGYTAQNMEKCKRSGKKAFKLGKGCFRHANEFLGKHLNFQILLMAVDQMMQDGPGMALKWEFCSCGVTSGCL